MSLGLSQLLKRRGFLKSCLGSLGKLGVISTLWSLGACQNSSREKKDIPKEPIALAHLDTLNPGFNEFKVFRTGVFLQEVGGRKTISAVSLLCTHQTCAISFEGARFRCPCHGSIFSKEGQRLAGPARKPLRWFKLSISEGGEVFLHPWERVDSGWKLEIS